MKENRENAQKSDARAARETAKTPDPAGSADNITATDSAKEADSAEKEDKAAAFAPKEPSSLAQRALRALPWVPLALALPLIWALSKEEVAVKPIVWVSIVCAAVFALRTAFRIRKMMWLDYLLAALCGVAATHVLFYPGFPRGHDITTHLWGTYGFYQEILAGNPLPRWIHHIGLGMPFLMFYPPIAFYLMLPFLGADLPTYDAFKYGFVLFNLLSGVSMFFVVRRWTGSRRAALIAAVAYCYAPYHLLESQYRVAVAEAAAMAILPLFFYYVHRAVLEPSRRTWRTAAFWIAALTLTHPLSLSMAGTAMGIWLLATYRLRFGRPLFKALALLALLAVLGLSLAGYYTVPVAAESQYVSITNTLGGKQPMYYGYGLKPRELVERREWFKWQRAEKRGSDDERNEMPYYFGITLLALIPLARASERKEVVLGLKAVTLGTLLLTLTPMDMVFARFPPMTMLQFPWRFLAIASCGASALAGFATLRLLETTKGHWLERAVPGVLAGLMIFDFFPYQGAALWQKPYEGIYRMSASESASPPFRVDQLDFPPADADIDLSLVRRVYPEYFARSTRKLFKNAKDDESLERVSVAMTFKGGKRKLNPAPYAEFFPENGGPSRALEFTRAGEEIRVDLPGEAGRLEIKEQWFPGWIETYGKVRKEVDATSDGLMMTKLKATDSGVLTLRFSRTRWDRLAGILLSVGTLAGLFLPFGRRKSSPAEV